jgi:hypothetical protein
MPCRPYGYDTARRYRTHAADDPLMASRSSPESRIVSDHHAGLGEYPLMDSRETVLVSPIPFRSRSGSCANPCTDRMSARTCQAASLPLPATSDPHERPAVRRLDPCDDEAACVHSPAVPAGGDRWLLMAVRGHLGGQGSVMSWPGSRWAGVAAGYPGDLECGAGG